jgi:hypothetical protein
VQMAAVDDGDDEQRQTHLPGTNYGSTHVLYDRAGDDQFTAPNRAPDIKKISKIHYPWPRWRRYGPMWLK